MHTQDKVLATIGLQDSGVPIYVQLRDQFLRTIGEGRLRPGDQMPTMRQVAVALRVDLNTVRHAYEELERAGAVALVRGKGSFVSQPPAPMEPGEKAERLETLAHQTLAAATALGVEPRALADHIAALAAQREEDR